MKLYYHTLLVLILLLVLGLAGLHRLSVADGQNTKSDVKTIPLEMLYSTNGQKGIKSVGEVGASAIFPGQLYQKSLEIGASNVFLVDAKNVATAMRGNIGIMLPAPALATPVRALTRDSAAFANRSPRSSALPGGIITWAVRMRSDL